MNLWATVSFDPSESGISVLPSFARILDAGFFTKSCMRSFSRILRQEHSAKGTRERRDCPSTHISNLDPAPANPSRSTRVAWLSQEAHSPPSCGARSHVVFPKFPALTLHIHSKHSPISSSKAALPPSALSNPTPTTTILPSPGLRINTALANVVANV